MTSRVVLATIAATLVCTASSGQPAAASASEGPVARASACNSIKLGGRGYVFFKSGLSCRRAKRLARHVHRTRRPPDRRWRCSSGSGFKRGGFCHRRGRTFSWHPGD